MRRRLLIVIPLAICLWPAEVGSAPIDVKEYLALRKKLGPLVALASLKADLQAHVGKIVEIRGRLAGLLKRDDAGSVIISTDGSGSFVLNTESLPADSPGVELACLAKIGEANEYRLVAWTYDAELVRREQAAKKTAAPNAPQQKHTQSPSAQSSAGNAAAKPAALSVDEMVRVYRDAVKRFNPKLTASEADIIARSVLGFSYKYGVDARLVCAVILAESNFRVNATSRAGAQGLGQLMPGTAAGLGVTDAYNPVENIYGSVRYIKSMLDRVSGGRQWNELTWNDLALALAAYNAGPGAVKKHGGIPPYQETRNYVRKVTSIYKQLCGIR